MQAMGPIEMMNNEENNKRHAMAGYLPDVCPLDVEASESDI